MRLNTPALALALALVAPHVSAEDIQPGTALYTNAVTYCAEAKAVLIDEFDIAYWRANNSITFSFSFASVESNLNVSGNIYLNDYGNTLFNETLDICSYFEGVLCPLPQVNFTGYGTYPLPTSLTGSFPSLAWTVPNLEAYARVELINVDTGEVAACLQATLSNGWSTQQTSVKWATGMFTLAAGLVALFHAALTNSPSPALYRWFDVLFLFQTAAAAGLLHLNYPLVYSNFAQNFAWSLGLFYSAPMQASIGTMRDKTGGDLSDSAYSQVQYINRKLSPYNELVAFNVSDATSSVATFRSFLANVSTPVNSLVSRASIPSTVDQDAASELTTGIPVYTNTASIPEANAFDTVFFFFLAFVAIVLAFHVVLFVLVSVLDRFASRHAAWATRLRRTWWEFCAGNALRTCLVLFFPLFIFGFYQWTLGESDSKLSLFFSVFGMFIVFAPLVAVFILSILRARRQSSTSSEISRLYTDYRFFHSVGVLYRAYRQRYHFFWFAPHVLAMVARAGFIGAGQSNAWAQVIGCMVVEAIVFVSLLACRPHKDRKGDWLAPFLSFCRLAMFGLLVAFIESVGVKAIIRTIIGFALIVLVGIPTILLLFGLIWNMGYGYLWRRNKRRVEDGTELESADSDDGSDHRAMRYVDGAPFVTATGSTPVLDSPRVDWREDRQGDESSVTASVGRPTSVAYREEGFDANGNESASWSHLSRSASDPSDEAAAADAYAEAARGGGVARGHDYVGRAM